MTAKRSARAQFCLILALLSTVAFAAGDKETTSRNKAQSSIEKIWQQYQNSGSDQTSRKMSVTGKEQIIRSAAESENPIGQYLLGKLCDEGFGTSTDYTEAVKWYRKAAEQGFAPAQDVLGFMYAEGKGVPKDDAEAAKWFRKAADQGSATAQASLGFMYEAGEGVPQDDAEAAKWFRKAAEQGDAEAQGSLGVMYAEGKGVPKDDAEAAKWFRKAADQGSATAQASLGFINQSQLSSSSTGAVAPKEFNGPVQLTVKPSSLKLNIGETDKVRVALPSTIAENSKCTFPPFGAYRDRPSWMQVDGLEIKPLVGSSSNQTYSIKALREGTFEVPISCEIEGREVAPHILRVTVVDEPLIDEGFASQGGPPQEVILRFFPNVRLYAGRIVRGNLLVATGLANIPAGTTVYPVKFSDLKPQEETTNDSEIFGAVMANMQNGIGGKLYFYQDEFNEWKYYAENGGLDDAFRGFLQQQQH